MESCWNQWESYWSLYDERFTFISQQEATSVSSTTWLVTSSWTEVSSSPISTESYTFLITETGGVDGFPLSTTTSSDIGADVIYTPVSTISTGTVTFTMETWHSLYSPIPTSLPTPACGLPSYVPQCQSQWESFVSVQWSDYLPWGRVSPQCTQASAQSTLCATLRSQYLEVAQQTDMDDGPNDETAGAIDSTSSYTSGNVTNFNDFTVWPTQSTLFPGCTLGCLSCAITGGKVRLIYWPEGTSMPSNMSSTARLNTPMSAVPRSMTSASEVNSTESGLRIALGLGTTFTSPTVYISYNKLYASDSCSGVGPTYHNTIVPITNSAELRSLWATFNYGMLTGLNTASFNFTDLNTPVCLVLVPMST